MKKTEFLEYLKNKIDSSERVKSNHEIDKSSENSITLYWEAEDMNRGFYLEPRTNGFRILVRCWRPQVSKHKHYDFSALIGRINIENSPFVERIADELFEMALEVELSDLKKRKSRRATTTEIHWKGDDFRYVDEE